nr:hypothetical protein [Chthoniobacteraceae bacterium]
PEITRLETMDAISGRGKFWTPPADQVSRTVRDLATQIRLVGHQMDVVSGQPLPRTGYQPEKLSDAARREQQKLNELKRRHGVVVTDPASQLGSALAARKTYYTHRIADLKSEIANRARIVKNRSLPPSDPALEALKAEYEQVKAEHDEVFGGRDLTDAQRLKLALGAAERNATRWAERLERAKKGDFTSPPSLPSLKSAELDAIRARSEALKAEVDYLHDLAFPKKTPDQIALQSLKTRLATEKADLQARLAKGDFSPRRKPPRNLPLDREAADAKADVLLLREEFQRGLDKANYERKTRAQKFWIGVGETLNLSRAIKTSWDVSAVGRQGAFIGIGNPLRAALNLKPMLEAMVSERRAAAIDAQIQSRPNAPLYAQSKLFLAPREGSRLSAMEEAFMSRLAKRIPGVRASGRAYITFLNKLRADTFDSLHADLVKSGTASPAELQAIANYINVATGRGTLPGRTAAAGEFLATTFFAPRLVISRFQLLAGSPLYGGTARTRYLVAREYGKFLGGLAVIYGLGTLAGASLETDRRSADFGKLKFGNTRVDPLAGLAQATVLLARIRSGQTKKENGKIAPAPLTQTVGNFLRNKLAPTLGNAADARDILVGQKPPPGHPQTLTGLAFDTVTPIPFSDIWKLMEEEGIPAGTAFSLLSLLGVSVQNYESQKTK